MELNLNNEIELCNICINPNKLKKIKIKNVDFGNKIIV